MSRVHTLGILRALAWLRWRVLINTLTRSGARDFLERLSRAAESVLPLAIVVLLTPAAIALGGLGVWTGSVLGGRPAEADFALQVVRWTLLLALVLTLLGPALFAAGQHADVTIRLLLLPISTRVLYLAHALGGLADPWVFLSIPLLAGIPIGLAASGALGNALLAFAAGAAFLGVLLGVAALSGAALQLLVRNRKRAELAVLVSMLLIVVVSLLPSLFIPPDGEERREEPPAETEIPLPGWARAAAAAVPSELYVRTLRLAGRGAPAAAAGGGAVLLVWGALAHALTWPVYRRLLQTPATSGGARRVTRGRGIAVVIPGAGPVTAAVALAYARLGFRTPRGRSIVLMPVVMLLVFAAMFYVRGTGMPIGPARVGGGYSLAIFGFVLALMSLGPLAFNQFAVDGPGLTLEFLAPVSSRELLYGKAIGGALIAAVPCALSLAAGLVTGGGSLLPWAAILCGASATYLVLAPAAAVLSVLFPKAVDLSSIGQASNAHQAAGLLGVLAFAVSCAAPAVLAFIGLRLLGGPAGATALVVGWLAVSIPLALVGFRIAERLLDDRKENLAMVAQGR